MSRAAIRCIVLLLCGLLGLPAEAQPQGQRTPPAQDRTVTIVNRASVAITTLYVSSTQEDNWGANRLTGQMLAAGRSFQLRLGPGRECRFDLQAVYSDGKMEERRDQDICRNRQVVFDGSQAVQPVDRTERKIMLRNRAPRAIRQVFISPKGANGWGDDTLSGPIASGAEAELSYQGDCVVDLRVVFDNASAEERREADLCDRSSVLIAPGWTTTDDIASTEADLPRAVAVPAGSEITVVNVTGKTLDAFYVFPEGAAVEGPDRLGSNTLDDGAHHRFRLDRRGACQFAVHGVFANAGGDLRRRDVDLCATSEIRLDGNAVTVPAAPPSAGITRLRNAGQAQMVAVFADPPGSPRSVDRLGGRLLRPGETFDLAPPVAGQCRYRIAVIYRDGRNTEMETDLCATREMALP